MLGPLATEESRPGKAIVQAQSAGPPGDGLSVENSQTPSGETIPFKQAFLVSIAAGLGYGFDSYAVNIFGMLSPVMMKELDISVTAIGVIGSLFLVGYTIGTIFFGYLADRVGRQKSLKFSIALYGTTTVLGGMVSNLYAITGLRFLTGVGGAGELAVGAPYTAEMWPPKYRALGTGGIMFSLYSLGYIVAAIAALAIVPVYGWRWAFIFAAVPAALVYWLRSSVEDSPRFREAQVEMERLVAEQGIARPKENIWKIPGAKKRIVIGWLLYTANACGYWGITFFLTTFMIQKFNVTLSESIFYAMLFYMAQFFLSFVGTGLSDLIGRRPAGILGALIMIVCTIMATTAETLDVFLIYGAVMIGMLGWLWGVGDTYLSEFFRTSLRGTGFGIMVGGGRAVSILAPLLVGWGIHEFGPTAPFLATAALWVLTIIGYYIGPETAGKELEEVQL
ncbi:MFS transporter [Hyphomicrobium methylovorum]|uniref:MFS transporter n=1 Tax=Hyphomicrobium methylovorum TaxID=84 RepID=UPI0015E7B340|nr:MFS transporter [Hyphomicrobium methylovorum]MBA2125607.1 MFS transporter [Hyphomicrobium methylovorum]